MPYVPPARCAIPRDAAAPAAESTDAEYTDAQIEMIARAAAKAAGFGPRTWTLKISGGRVQLVVTGQKTTEADGLVVTVEARATVTL